MEAIQKIAMICIFIEVWHIIYYSFLYKKYFERTEKLILCVQTWDKLSKNYKEFCEYCTSNSGILEALGLESDMDALIYNETERDVIKYRILKSCSMRGMALFLIQQFIELLYYLFIILLALCLPGINGLVLFIVLMVLSSLEKHYNKDKNAIFLNIDSLLCIGLFMLVIFSYI